MIEFVTYNKATGEIQMMWSAPSEDFMIDSEEMGCVLGKYEPSDYYILDGEVTERPASSVTRAGLILSDVPTGSKLYINGESYEAEGDVELEFPMPGTYALRVESWPYQDFTDEVTV